MNKVFDNEPPGQCPPLLRVGGAGELDPARFGAPPRGLGMKTVDAHLPGGDVQLTMDDDRVPATGRHGAPQAQVVVELERVAEPVADQDVLVTAGVGWIAGHASGE